MTLTALFVLFICNRRESRHQNCGRNNGLFALYESALAIITNCYILVGADCCRRRWLASTARVIMETVGWKINHDIIQVDVWALPTNSSWHIFAGTCFGGGVFRSTDKSWKPVNNALDCGNICSLAIDPCRDYLCRNSRMRKRASIAPLTTAIVGRLPT